MDENLTDEGESDNKLKSVSKRKQLEDKEGSPDVMEESDEEKPDTGGRLDDNMESSPQDAQKSEEKQHSEEDNEVESSEASGEQAKGEEKANSEDIQGEQAKEEDNSDSEDIQGEQAKEEHKSDSEDIQADEAKEEEKSGFEDNQETDDVASSPVKPEKTKKEPAAGDAEISDDEPLVRVSILVLHNSCLHFLFSSEVVIFPRMQSKWKHRVGKRGSKCVR